jgi:hypothetical protein
MKLTEKDDEYIINDYRCYEENFNKNLIFHSLIKTIFFRLAPDLTIEAWKQKHTH